jgi:hypothetical protein
MPGVRRSVVSFSLVAAAIVAAGAVFLATAEAAGPPARVTGFTGITLPDTRTAIARIPDRYAPIRQALGRGATPPDTQGAAGPSDLVEMVNGAYAFYRKDGTRVAAGSLSRFWTAAGIVNAARRPLIFDPVVQYDPLSRRFFAIAEDNSIGVTNPPLRPNRILLAVSRTSDPTRGWKGYAWPSNRAAIVGSERLWADQATLGFNRSGVFIAANTFSLGRSDFPPDKTMLLVIRKADLLAGVANGRVRITRFDRLRPSVTGVFVQPAIDLDGTGGASELVLSDLSARPAAKAGRFKATVITGSIDHPRLRTDLRPISVRSYAAPPTARQPGGPDNIDTGKSQSFFAPTLIIRDGSLWGVENVGYRGRVALRWFRLDAATKRLRQEGLVASPNLDCYYGSIAVADFARVVIGFTASGQGRFASSYAAIGRSRRGRTSFGIPRLLKAGVGSYDYRPGGARNRWGDYSATALDPGNARAVWTFQEFAAATDTWGTEISRIQPAP